MKAILAALGVLGLAACNAPIRPERGSFDWLAGCWHLDRDDGGYDEAWLPPGPDGTLGVSREVRGGRTVSWEFLRIELREGTLFYVAQPSGQRSAEFRMVVHEPGHLAFENPQHDFPTRIEYRLDGLNSITARVSGPRKDGSTHAAEYPMQRVACE